MTPKPRLLVCAGILAVLALACTVARTYAYPEPAPFPITWEFDFSHGRPTPIAIRGEDGKYHWFWYMQYKVVNRTGEDRLFIPEVSITTDQGDIVPAGKKVPSSVYPAIKAALGNRLLLSPTQVVGRMLQGEDYAKESVVIWPDFGHDIDQLNIMVSGLSGEKVTSTEAPPGAPAAATQPASGPTSAPDTSPKTYTYRKTLMISYDLPGTGGRIQDTTIVPRGEKWVMR